MVLASAVDVESRPMAPSKYEIECEPRKEHTLKIHPATVNPPEPGKYLLLCYEWVGNHLSKPDAPDWFIRTWDGKQWSRRQYTFDTGGYENFEPRAWCELPPHDFFENRPFATLQDE